MKREDYRNYLILKRSADQTVRTSLNALQYIENRYEIDLDDEFDKDSLQSLVDELSYSRQDERENKRNSTKINIENGSIYNALAFYRSHLSNYRKFKVNPEPLADGENILDDDVEAVRPNSGEVFALERDLQSALRDSIDDLEPGLSIVDGGRERKVDAGFIDILAKDQQGSYVVVELKAGESRPAALTQTLSYMASIKASESAPVRGYLIAAKHHPQVVLAAEMLPNLTLKTYRYRFEFN